MAITIDYSTYPYVINIGKSSPMVQIQSTPTEIWQLSVDTLHDVLRDLEDDVEGMPFPLTHVYVGSFTVSGATLAAIVDITDDYVVTFENGSYRVNLVGANNNVGDRATVNNVSVSSSNSAGLQDLNSLQIASFQGGVAVDVNSPFSGTEFPIGTRQTPVNNFDDAKTIADDRGLKTFYVARTTTLSTTTNLDGYSFVGDSPVTVTLTIDPSAQVANSEFRDLTITGTLDGGNILRDCSVLTLNYVNGIITRCAINGTITLGGGAQASLLECHSGVAGGGPGQTADIDFNGAGNSLILRDYDGGVTLENYAGGGDVSLDINSGRVIVDSTVTAGDIYVRGVATVDDQSTGTATVYDQTINKTVGDLGYGRKTLEEGSGATPGYLTIYSSDGILIGHKELYRDLAMTQGWTQGDTIFYEGELVLGPHP